MTEEKRARLRILLADDHPVVLEGLAALLDRQPDFEVAGRAGGGEEAVALFRRLAPKPDVTLVDLRMGAMGGVEAIEAIRAIDRDARVLVLTTFDGDEDVFRAVAAGAKGYLLKDAPPETVFEAIRAAARGERVLPPGIAARLAERSASPGLSPRETEVLSLVSRGLANKEIAAKLFISEGTVKTHVDHVLEKLGASDRTHAVRIAIERGILKL